MTTWNECRLYWCLGLTKFTVSIESFLSKKYIFFSLPFDLCSLIFFKFLYDNFSCLSSCSLLYMLTTCYIKWSTKGTWGILASFLITYGAASQFFKLLSTVCCCHIMTCLYTPLHLSIPSVCCRQVQFTTPGPTPDDASTCQTAARKAHFRPKTCRYSLSQIRQIFRKGS